MHSHLGWLGPLLPAAAGWCGAPPRSLSLLLFVTGLVGGLAHCGTMCGPFVLTQAAAVGGGPGGPTMHRLAGGLLLPYHLGRVVTYAGLGAAAATLGLAVVALGPLRQTFGLLLAGAALLFLVQGLARLAPSLATTAPRHLTTRIARGWAERLAGACRRLLARPTALSRFTLGIVLGLLPCGFLYGALAAAAAVRSPLAGAVAMAAFGLGTVPALLLVGLGGASLAARGRAAAGRLIAPLFLFNAVMLSAMAVAALAPA